MDNKYYDCLGALVNEMGSRDFTAYMYRKIFDAIYCVAFYRQQLVKSETPESEALARWSLGDARNLLNDRMSEYGFDDDLKRQVRYVSESELSVREL